LEERLEEVNTMIETIIFWWIALLMALSFLILISPDRYLEKASSPSSKRISALIGIITYIAVMMFMYGVFQ
jgi:hypothetical protein